MRIKLNTLLHLFFTLTLAFSLNSKASLSCAALFSDLKTVQELLTSSSRPEIEDVLKVLKSPEAEVLKNKNRRSTEDILFKTYHEAAMELLQTANGRTVYLFARDGEWIYDAIQTILKQHANGHKISERFKLINVSRLIARNHTPSQLQNFLRANGMNLERILRGEEKILWVDTGNRGSIYLNLYEAILNMIDYSRSAELVNSEITNLIQGIDGILISSREIGTSPQVINAINSKQWSNAKEVSEYLSKALYFNEYLTTKRVTLGIPEDRYQRYKWVVNNIEHTPHFHGRAATLDAGGAKITSFENDPFSNKEDSLGLQLRIAEYFSSQESKLAFKEFLENLLGKPPQSSEGQVVAMAEPAAAIASIKLNQLKIPKLKGGELIEMPSGKVLQYIKPGGNGRRGIVLQVKDSSNKIYALKIARDNQEDTIQSFAEEITKAQSVEKAGFRTAKIVESGVTFHLKEWIEGPLANEWLATWSQNGYRRNDPALLAIRNLLRESARRGLYTGDLNRKNLIWIGEWVVIDSGSTTSSYTQQEALNRYYENISSRWAKDLNTTVAHEFRRALEE